MNSFTTGYRQSPSVASDAIGNFVVVWEGQGQNDGLGIFGQRYDSVGIALGGEFRVNSFTTSSQGAPAVASDENGNFAVVWHSNTQDGNGYGIFGRRYDSGGVPQGNEFQVNSFTTSSQRNPSLASDASGNFCVVWHSLGSDGSLYGVFGQRYDNAGVAQGNEFLINSFTTGSQRFPSVGATGTNQFVVVWQSDGQDGSSYGVFGQRFNFAGDLPSLSIEDLSATEGNLPGRSSRKFVLLQVSLSAPSEETVRVRYATVDGTATSPSDYTARSGTIVFHPGETRRFAVLIVNEDNLPEGDETFSVILSNATNATIADGEGVVTILNDDP